MHGKATILNYNKQAYTRPGSRTSTASCHSSCLANLLILPWFVSHEPLKPAMVRVSRTISLMVHETRTIAWRELSVSHITLYRQTILKASGEGHFIRIFKLSAKGDTPGNGCNT